MDLKKGYLIKKTMYQDANGDLFESVYEAALFPISELPTDIGNGEIIAVFRPAKKPVKPSRRNQLWMRGEPHEILQ